MKATSIISNVLNAKNLIFNKRFLLDRVDEEQSLVLSVATNISYDNQLQITDQPTEFGASITDNSFIQPKNLTIDLTISNIQSLISQARNIISGDQASATLLSSYVKPIYKDVLGNVRYDPDSVISRVQSFINKMQKERIPMKISLPSIEISNLYITNFTPSYNNETGYESIVGQLTLREILSFEIDFSGGRNKANIEKGNQNNKLLNTDLTKKNIV